MQGHRGCILSESATRTAEQAHRDACQRTQCKKQSASAERENQTPVQAQSGSQRYRQRTDPQKQEGKQEAEPASRAPCQHRIRYNNSSLLDGIRKLTEIFMRLMCSFITVKTDVSDLCSGNKSKDAVYHTKTCS